MDMKMALEAIRSEMKPSMGCTEPVAIGLAVSRACALLEKPATHLDMVISSNIFKNAYSVQIPNAGTNGIELSCVLGCLLADPDNTMEIFAKVKPEHVEKGQKLVEEGFVTVKVLKSSARTQLQKMPMIIWYILKKMEKSCWITGKKRLWKKKHMMVSILHSTHLLISSKWQMKWT